MVMAEILSGGWYKLISYYLIISHLVWNWEPEQGFGNHFYHKVHKVEHQVHPPERTFSVWAGKIKPLTELAFREASL